MAEQLKFRFFESSRPTYEADILARIKITLEYYKELVKKERSKLTTIRLKLVIAANKGSGLFDGSEFKRRFQLPVEDFLSKIDELAQRADLGEDVSYELQQMVEEFERWKATYQS